MAKQIVKIVLIILLIPITLLFFFSMFMFFSIGTYWILALEALLLVFVIIGIYYKKAVLSFFKKHRRVIVVTVIAFILIGSVSWSWYLQDRKIFTVEKWGRDVWSREYMLDDFLNKHELIGMTKEEVQELLGDKGTVEGAECTYYIGKGWIDPVTFDIYFDDNGKVNNYSIGEG